MPSLAQYRFLFAAFFAVLGSFFYAFHASAQTNCCFIQQSRVEYTCNPQTRLFREVSRKKLEEDLCRLVTDAEPCAAGTQVNVVYGIAGDGGCRPDTISPPFTNDPNTQYTTKEATTQDVQAVDCAEKGQICIKAVHLLTDCRPLNTILLCRGNINCFWSGECFNRNDSQICGQIVDPDYCGKTERGETLGSLACQWDVDQKVCITSIEHGVASQYRRTGGFFSPCVYAGNCRSVNDLVLILVSVAKEMFKYIGSIAFVFFVYGGVTIILSFGNAEKVKKGQQILVAAVVGLIISFGAFVLVGFLLDILQVAKESRGI